MDILSTLGELLGGAASGGLFGLLGSIVGVGAKWLQERQRQQWQREKWSHEEALLRLEMQRGAAETEQELLIVQEKAAALAKVKSYDLQITAGPVSRWVNDIRSLFRPGLTVFLWIVVGVLMWMLLGGGLSGIIDAQDAIALVDYAIRLAIFAASAATVWWFGDRAMQPPNRPTAAKP